MSGATTAVAIGGAAAVGAAASSSAASKASKSADKATQASSEATAAQLAFSKEQYEDWKSVFGDVQDNLASYYKNLTPATIEAVGIQNINQQYSQANKQITQTLAQRGISGSGLEAQAMVDLAQKQAQDTATLRTQAPQLAANEKMKFLALGLNQGANAVSSVNQAYGTQATLAANQANLYTQQAAQASAGIGSSLSSGINSYMSINAMNNQNLLLQNALGAGSYNPSLLGTGYKYNTAANSGDMMSFG